MTVGTRIAQEGRRRWRVAASMASALLALTSCSILAGPGRAHDPAPTSDPLPSSAQLHGETVTPLPSHSRIPSTNNASARTRQPGWILTWSKEFNGPARHPSGWAYLQGGTGWSHRQLQYFTASNAYIDGHGHLVLSARKGGQGYSCWYGPCQYTSVRMQTQGIFAQKYGMFEARIKIPVGQGIWPAFWIKGEQSEIDIIETNSKKSYQVHSGAHAPGMNHTGTVRLGQPVSAGYHVFGAIWNRKGITWTIDGRAYSHVRAYPGWTFNTPFYLILEVAVGGTWPGPPDASTPFPSRMSVDWIRVYRQAN